MALAGHSEDVDTTRAAVELVLSSPRHNLYRAGEHQQDGEEQE